MHTRPVFMFERVPMFLPEIELRALHSPGRCGAMPELHPQPHELESLTLLSRGRLLRIGFWLRLCRSVFACILGNNPVFSIKAKCSGNVAVFGDSFHIIQAGLESTT